jgi:hypothetical protein
MGKIKKAVKVVRNNLGKNAFKKANETIRKAQEDVRRDN